MRSRLQSLRRWRRGAPPGARTMLGEVVGAPVGPSTRRLGPPTCERVGVQRGDIHRRRFPARKAGWGAKCARQSAVAPVARGSPRANPPHG